jgi:asparagine synthase (glutamine-hydrolysing)
LGHTRLSIIDLSERANQPFTSSDGTHIIVFNGEIYNYKELGLRLDHGLKTDSDTEVLIESYAQCGEKIFNDLEGMFAFAVYDKAEHSLTLVRDHLGIKPLYVYRDNDWIVAASEIKAIRHLCPEQDIDSADLHEFMLNGFCYEPATGYEKIKKVKPGAYLKIDLSTPDGAVKEHQYWRPNLNGAYGSEALAGMITHSVQEHLVSDVQLGVFFSGGTDSSVIMSEVPDATRSIFMRAKPCELRRSGIVDDYYYAKGIADRLGKDLTVIDLEDTAEFLQNVEMVAKEVEELTLDYTYVSSKAISGLARKENMKVMLSGMGADEVFAGYPRYRLVQYEWLYRLLFALMPRSVLRSSSFTKKRGRLQTFLCETNFIMKYTALVGYFSQTEVDSLLVHPIDATHYVAKLESLIDAVGGRELSPLKKAMVLDLYGYLSHNFIVADKSSMQKSIELRVPLATRKLVETTLSMPDDQLLSLFDTKKTLKRILRKHLPRRFIYRTKSGFNPPLDGKIDTYVEQFDDIFAQGRLYDYVRRVEAQRLIHQHVTGVANNTYKLYQLLYLSFWLNNRSTI